MSRYVGADPEVCPPLRIVRFAHRYNRRKRGPETTLVRVIVSYREDGLKNVP